MTTRATPSRYRRMAADIASDVHRLRRELPGTEADKSMLAMLRAASDVHDALAAKGEASA